MSGDIDVVDGLERAHTLLDATRLEILARLEQPASAAELARTLHVPRQRLNYHLHQLERDGFVTVHHEATRGSVRQRVYRRTHDRYAIAPTALGALRPDPDRVQDRFSSAYQIAVASRAIADLAELRAGAAAAGKSLPTMTIEVDVRFRDAAQRAAFAQELGDAVAALVGKYHDQRSADGRTYRLYVGAYPRRAGGVAPAAPPAEPPTDPGHDGPR